MTDTKVLRVKTLADDRTDEERAAAAPVSLPAGSYDGEKLAAALEDAKPEKGETVEQARERAAAEHNETEFRSSELGVPPGYRRVAVENEDLGVVENRVVYDESLSDKAAAAQAAAPPALQPGRGDTGDTGERQVDKSLLEKTIPMLTVALDSVDSVPHLHALREAEAAGQNRDGALGAIDNRISALSGDAGKQGE